MILFWFEVSTSLEITHSNKSGWSGVEAGQKVGFAARLIGQTGRNLGQQSSSAADTSYILQPSMIGQGLFGPPCWEHGQGLAGFNSLLSRLQSSEDFGASEADFSKADGPALSEEQVGHEVQGHMLRGRHMLRGSGPVLPKEQGESQELARRRH
eukprot:1149083-Pelagomonas_calceolata.AAC.3